MKIESVKLSEITPYERNAKKHPQRQIEQIKKSITDFGNNDPIAVDENGMIIEGHGRYEALKQLGVQYTEVIRLTGLTEEQKRAYVLVHNKLTMNTGFDPELLRRELESIASIDLGDFDLQIDTELEPEPEPDQAGDGLPELIKFNLTLAEDQYQLLAGAMELIDYTVEQQDRHRFGNPNKRNNLVFEVIYQWAEQKKLL